MDNISTLISRLKPDIIGIIEELGLLTTTTTSSGEVLVVLTPSQYPDAILRDGSRSLLNSLAVASGATIDGVDLDVLQSDYNAHDAADAVTAHGTVGAHAHTDAPSGGILDHGALSGLADDDHTQYASADGSGTRNAYRAERLTKQVIAGAGLTGGGPMDADRTVNVGAGTGINVAADAIGVDTGATFGWTGAHTFSGSFTLQVNAIVRSLIPELTDTYDLGSTTKWWNKGYISELDAVVFAEQTAQLLGGYLIIPKDAGTLPADVASGATTINFGKAMTVGHFVVFRSVGQVEYIQVGSLVSGTTYNVTRSLDPSGANDWPAGSPFCVLGTSGDGRIELNAYDTPRIQLLRQGATYNAQTELIRLGDLNGNWGYSGETYGLAIGEYGSNLPNITIDSTNGLRIRNHSTTIISLDTSGNASIIGTLDVDGTLTAGPYAKIDPNGFTIDTNVTSETVSAKYKIVEGANTLLSMFAFNGSPNVRAGFVAGSTAFDKDAIGELYTISKSTRSASTAIGALSGGLLGNVSGLTFFADNAGNSSASFKTDVVDLNAAVIAVDASTSFPSSPVTNYLFYRTDFRAWFVYDGSNWKQISIGSFASSFPASPVDNLRVYREDKDEIYFYNNATSKWLSVTIYQCQLLEQTIAPLLHDNAHIGTSDTVIFNMGIDVVSQDVYVFGMVNLFIVTTNNATNFYNVTIEVVQNDGGGTATTLLNAHSTSGYSANTSNQVALTAGTFAAVAQNGIVRVKARRAGTTGLPGRLSCRPNISYRKVLT